MIGLDNVLLGNSTCKLKIRLFWKQYIV